MKLLPLLLLSATAFAAPPRYDHVVVVVEENRTYGQIIGDTVATQRFARVKVTLTP